MFFGRKSRKGKECIIVVRFMYGNSDSNGAGCLSSYKGPFIYYQPNKPEFIANQSYAYKFNSIKEAEKTYDYLNQFLRSNFRAVAKTFDTTSSVAVNYELMIVSPDLRELYKK